MLLRYEAHIPHLSSHVHPLQLKHPDRLRKEAAVVAMAQLLGAGDIGEGMTAANTVGAFIHARLVGGSLR